MSQFEPGKLVNLSRLVHRIVAPNAGMMTGPGTNTYLVGNQELAVIDPGPNDSDHIDAIINAANQLRATIKWIVCTHTHADHSPGAMALKQKTHAQVYGQVAPKNGMSQDQSFQPDVTWGKESHITCPEFSLAAIHTPGHASNHWCYLLEDEALLLTGDHIMNGSTVVIAPPDGNMSAYIASLEKLKAYDINHIAPGHGDLIDNPQEVIEGTIQHRLMRETKTLEKLREMGEASLDNLVERVYDEVPIFLHELAKYSLLAHLEKLQAEGKVIHHNQQWKPVTK